MSSVAKETELQKHINDYLNTDVLGVKNAVDSLEAKRKSAAFVLTNRNPDLEKFKPSPGNHFDSVMDKKRESGNQMTKNRMFARDVGLTNVPFVKDLNKPRKSTKKKKKKEGFNNSQSLSQSKDSNSME